MKYLILVLILVSVAMALPSKMVLPIYPDLAWQNDTLHVTTSEKGWALSAKSYQPLIINDTGGWLHFRFDTDAGPMYSLIEANGTGPLPFWGIMTAAVDSVFIDAEIAGVVYIEWYAVP